MIVRGSCGKWKCWPKSKGGPPRRMRWLGGSGSLGEGHWLSGSLPVALGWWLSGCLPFGQVVWPTVGLAPVPAAA